MDESKLIIKEMIDDDNLFFADDDRHIFLDQSFIKSSELENKIGSTSVNSNQEQKLVEKYPIIIEPENKNHHNDWTKSRYQQDDSENDGVNCMIEEKKIKTHRGSSSNKMCVDKRMYDLYGVKDNNEVFLQLQQQFESNNHLENSKTKFYFNDLSKIRKNILNGHLSNPKIEEHPPNNKNLVDQKRQIFSHNRTVSDDAVPVTFFNSLVAKHIPNDSILNVTSTTIPAKIDNKHNNNVISNPSYQQLNYNETYVSLPSLNSFRFVNITLSNDHIVKNCIEPSAFQRNNILRSSVPLRRNLNSTETPLSILKSSSKSFHKHRKTCPKVLHQQLHLRNMNQNDDHTKDNRRNLKQSCCQERNSSGYDGNVDNFYNENNHNTATIREDDNLNSSVQYSNQQQPSLIDNDNFHQQTKRNTSKTRRNINIVDLITKTNNQWELFDDYYDYNKCTCHLETTNTITDSNVNTAKSVQILTPTKSEQVLFDPKLSAAESFFYLPPSSNHTHSHSRHHIQLNDDKTFVNDTTINKKDSTMKSQDDKITENSINDNDSCFIDTINRNKFIKNDYLMDLTKKTIQQQPYFTMNQSTYCDCSPEEIKPITYKICLNCHKPVNKSVKYDNENTSGITQEQSNLAVTSVANIHNSPSDPLIVDTYPNGLTNSSTYLLEPSVVYAPVAHLESYDKVNDLESSENLFNPSSYFIMDEDYPKLCRKCNIWYGSFDPSYPFTCNCSSMLKSQTMSTNDSGSVYSVHMQKDFRYYFQHPYSRLFVAYFVIFCNFLIFAEDPLSHSLMECSIPVLGNVISLLFTKYPPQYEWQCLKAMMSLLAIIIGLFVGKCFLHHIILRRIFRLKMFRDESGTWMIMLISAFLSCYLASQMYNTLLLMFHPDSLKYIITSKMGLTYSSFMKIAACGTWCGDFFTAWMITDMMLQDNLYPNWAKVLRAFWHKHCNIRILVFWTGSLVIAASVITIILTDAICWDCLTQGLFSTTEFSRAFLASSILVMDLLIVMQDWDFPHFVCDLNIKLPGLLQPSYTFNFFHKSVKFPAVEIKITGKWFNYGIIVFVMMLDLNMWKNQVIYYPSNYGQYVDISTNRVWSITDPRSIDLHHNNETIKWSYENRSRQINPFTNHTYIEDDLMIYSRYVGYVWVYKTTSLIPILAGFAFFLSLIYFYGRFPPKTDASMGGRLPKRRTYHYRSSWRRERRDDCRGRGHISWPSITVYDDDHQNVHQIADDNQSNINKTLFAQRDQLKPTNLLNHCNTPTSSTSTTKYTNGSIPTTNPDQPQIKNSFMSNSSHTKSPPSSHINSFFNFLASISSCITMFPSNLICTLKPICNHGDSDMSNESQPTPTNKSLQHIIDSPESNGVEAQDTSVHLVLTSPEQDIYKISTFCCCFCHSH